jgi:hypothetical protein
MRFFRTAKRPAQGPVVREHIDAAFEALKQAERAALQDVRLHDLTRNHHAQGWLAEARAKI